MVPVKKVVFLFLMICSSTQLSALFTWGSPVTLSASTMDNSTDPQVTVDTNGNATAAWVENGSVKASHLPINGTWGTPVVLSGSGASSPQLVCDGSGNVTAVWLSSNGTVTVSTLPLNGSWSASSAVSASGASTPAIAVNASGNLAVVWERSGYIESSTKLLGGLLSLVSTISAANSSNPDVAVGANGRVVTVWQTILNTGEATVESAIQSVIGGVWGSVVNILPAASSFSMNYPAVSVDPSGNADVIWYRYSVTNGVYSNVYVYSANLPSGSSSWSSPIQISDTGIGNPAGLFINMNTDGSGNKIATWSISYDGQSFVIESSYKAQGGAWSSFFAVTDQNLYAFQGGMSTDTLGNSVTAYMSFNGSSTDIVAAEASTAQIIGTPFWGNYTTLSSAGTNNGYPLIGTNYNSTSGTTYATAVWVNANGANTVIQAATASKTPVGPPSNVMVTQTVDNYGVFTDTYNTITWSASTDPSAVEYAFYRNGILIEQIPLTTLQFVDHNTTDNGSITYGVASIDANLFVSQIVSVEAP
jgi:hypothetical protein